MQTTFTAHTWRETLAIDLAHRLPTNVPRKRKFIIPNRLSKLRKIFNSAYEYFDHAVKTQLSVPSTAEWLLNNYYFVQQAIRQVEQGLPANHYFALPQTQEGWTRVHLLAAVITRHEESRFDIEEIQNFILTFQDVKPLMLSEVHAFPLMLQIAVLECLAEGLTSITDLNEELLAYPESWQSLTVNSSQLSSESIVMNSIRNLRLLAKQEWESFYEATCMLEKVLRGDPSGIFGQMDFKSRNHYTDIVQELGWGSPLSEIDIAQKAIQLAQAGRTLREQHVGYYLIGNGREALETEVHFQPRFVNIILGLIPKNGIKVYLGGITLLTFLFTFLVVFYGLQSGGNSNHLLIIGLLTFVPAVSLSIQIVNGLITALIPPHVLPRMNFKSGVPVEYRTIVVIPALLVSERDTQSLLKQIEDHFISNRDPNIFFALLTDYADAPEKVMPGDEQLINHLKSGIEQLNAKYEINRYRPFYLFDRERVWNPSEECWMGWERKRGKLEEFNKLLRGSDETTFSLKVGNLAILTTVRYVITLDVGTVLLRDGAGELISTLAHPLNQAQFDPSTDEITAGYTIIQPRMKVNPASANRSLFTRIFSSDSAIDLNIVPVSDIYNDLFREGNYAGIGIYEVDAFEKSLDNKIPENRLLSHGLFEGMKGHCGLATDVVLLEDYPPYYLVYADRLHRRVRGDWQLLPWLAAWVPHRTEGKVRNTLSILDRWKLLEKLQQSLFQPAVLTLLISGWLLLPGSDPVWMGIALAPYLMKVVNNFIRHVQHSFSKQHSDIRLQPLHLASLGALFEIIVLPYEALLVLDAISTTLVRIFITHRHLLQRSRTGYEEHSFSLPHSLRSASREMVVGSLLALFLSLIMFIFDQHSLLIASPFLFGWIASPHIVTRMIVSNKQPDSRITPRQEQKLRLLARSTWLYFEHFVGPEDRWLPPDHFQESPRGVVAHRTSPTNIGLTLLATLSAHDLGYIGPLELSLRLRDTFDSMDSLERVRGHFLNWYDTRSIASLPPRYISTVDSGNLAACLIALRQGCAEMEQTEILNWQGLQDTLDMLSVTLAQWHLGSAAHNLQAAISSLQDVVKNLNDRSQFAPALLLKLFTEAQSEFEAMLWDAIQHTDEEITSGSRRNIAVWIERVRQQLRHIRSDIQMLAPWLLALADARRPSRWGNNPGVTAAWEALQAKLPLYPQLGEIPNICEQARNLIDELMDLLDLSETDLFTWCETLDYDLQAARKNSISLLQNFSVLAARSDAFIESMDFGFLYESERRAFHIGYNVETGLLDSVYYDQLGSDARLTSLVAIALGDVPKNHWGHLSRPVTQFDGELSLLSWTGAMFEYLMPNLFTRTYPNTLLGESCRVMIEQQIKYASERNIPWGISEAACFQFESDQDYQYRGFGLPALGFTHRLSDDLVVAPYASILALPFFPQEALQNITRLENLKMWGHYGFYESVDFTPERLKTGESHAIVRSYMAHHQGMILLSLCNYVLGNPILRRFHADPRIRSVELLLQEQMPANIQIEQPRHQHVASRTRTKAIPLDPWRVSSDAPYTQIHALSNGKYSLLISAAGAGFSRWGNMELTRWRDDPTLDNHGYWIYVEDRLDGKLWSATHQPTMVPPDRSEVQFYPHRVEFERQDGEIVLRTVVTVAPHDEVEIRRITLTNHGNQPRILSLTSYAEIILNQQAADLRHPAYNKLFIESEFLGSEGILLFRRRPRSGDEQSVYLAHFFTSNLNGVELTGYETDRARFLGRGGTVRRPLIFSDPPESSTFRGTTGFTLDPICSLQAEVALSPYQTAQIAFITLVAPSRNEALDLARRYHRWSHISQQFSDVRSQVEEELAQLNLNSQKVEQIQKLLSPLLYLSPGLRADPAVLASNISNQASLHSMGISGDHPILVVRLFHEEQINLLVEVIQAHTYWRKRGLIIDLVICEKNPNYEQSTNLRTKIDLMINRSGMSAWLKQSGGVFRIDENQINQMEWTLLMTMARVVLNGDAGSLQEQLSKLDRDPMRLPRFVPVESPSPDIETPPRLEPPQDLLFHNGIGGFTADGREYVIHLQSKQWAPAPWSNVIATPEFGCIVSETGMGVTWSENSSQNRLTPWRNDPVTNLPSEAIYLRDEDTGQVWSPTPLPARADAAYLVRHGIGYSTFEHGSHGLYQTVKVFVVPDAPVKVVQFKMHNITQHMRRINVAYYAEWVLGEQREITADYITPEFGASNFALLAWNSHNTDFGQHVAFLAATREPSGVTTDRTEFLGRLGSYTQPAALERVGLTPRVEAGIDPCAALQFLLWLQPGETKEITFLLGQGKDQTDAKKWIEHFQDIQNVDAAWVRVSEFWNEILEQTQVQTPEPAMDLLMNRWLLYQSISCSFWTRTGLYESSGAYEFRDQLQNVMAYVHVRPDLVRQHIIESAVHQFEEGDVLHWWQPPSGRGVRTRCSDDMLWLPFVTAHYVRVTDDRSILDEEITFLSAEPLGPYELERHDQFPPGPKGTLFDHCCRAISNGMKTGQHGLPLIGAHDWNDDMNRVGHLGKGESIWLGWFLSATLHAFANICDIVHDTERANGYRAMAAEISKALEKNGWDGEWYLRAYYDDGSPLGSSANEECRIELSAQSWAVISGIANPERAARAMEAVYTNLVRPEDQLILLSMPPFQRGTHDPGSIKGYPRGIRGNSGQSTHAALWATWALAQMGLGDRAMELFRLVNPIYHANTQEKMERYQVEPYVIPANVYSAEPYVGRGGWTWNTSSAGLMYRLGLEMILGLQRSGNYLQIKPNIPSHWTQYQINYRFGKSLYHIVVKQDNAKHGEKHVSMDGKVLENGLIPLVNDELIHEIIIAL